MVYKCNCPLFEMENRPSNTCAKHFIKASTFLIVQSIELLHLSKSNESSIILVMWWCDGSIMLSNHELEDVGMVFPHNFHKFGIPPLNMVVCSFVSFCVDILHVHGGLWITTKPCLHKALAQSYQLWKFLSGSGTHIPYGYQLDGNEIVNAPLSCYTMKRINRKGAIMGLVQLSNLISSYNGNNKVATTGSSYKLLWWYVVMVNDHSDFQHNYFYLTGKCG